MSRGAQVLIDYAQQPEPAADFCSVDEHLRDGSAASADAGPSGQPPGTPTSRNARSPPGYGPISGGEGETTRSSCAARAPDGVPGILCDKE